MMLGTTFFILLILPMSDSMEKNIRSAAHEQAGNVRIRKNYFAFHFCAVAVRHIISFVSSAFESRVADLDSSATVMVIHISDDNWNDISFVYTAEQ